jgi:hypothetical protein
MGDLCDRKTYIIALDKTNLSHFRLSQSCHCLTIHYAVHIAVTDQRIRTSVIRVIGIWAQDEWYAAAKENPDLIV